MTSIILLAFRTDTDITQKKPAPGRERDLQAWVPSGDATLSADDDMFGPSNGTSWDQFTVNEQLFGVKASFDEDLYTTKLDRSAPDFKERERKAQKLANEIIGVRRCLLYSRVRFNWLSCRLEPATHTLQRNVVLLTIVAPTKKKSALSAISYRLYHLTGTNSHRYGAVVRGQNAYVPPGARKGGPLPLSQPAPVVAGEIPAKADTIPKVSVNGPDGAVLAPAQTPTVKTTASTPGAASTVTANVRDISCPPLVHTFNSVCIIASRPPMLFLPSVSS